MMRGFLFAEALKADLDKIEGSPLAADPDAPLGYPPDGTATGALYGVSAPPALADTAEVTGTISVYTVKATGRVSVAALTLIDAAHTGDASLAFAVSGVGTGTIEIGYHVWWDEDGATIEGQAGAPDTGTKKAKWHSAKETLTATVVAVD